jgi:putative transposase
MLKRSKSCVHDITVHLIFTVKYRKNLLIGYGDEVKQLLMDRTASSTTWSITTIEVDQDHVHMMIDMHPNERVSNIVRHLKSYTSYHMWQNHPKELAMQFWKRKMFWSPSYFVCSVGDASRETVQRYIDAQGSRPRRIHPRA